MSLKFGPAVRLRTRPEFTAVQEHGRRVATRYLTLLGRPNREKADRLGIIASRRLGPAVVRNRAKRRLRELFRREQPDTTTSRGERPFDFVAIPRREFVQAPFAEVARDFATAIRKLRSPR